MKCRTQLGAMSEPPRVRSMLLPCVELAWIKRAMLRIQPVSTAFFLSPVHAHIFVLTGNPRVAGEFYHKIILAAAPFRCRREVPPIFTVLLYFSNRCIYHYPNLHSSFVENSACPGALHTAGHLVYATWLKLTGKARNPLNFIEPMQRATRNDPTFLT